ncbi:MAG: TRAP transporter substrate-binding protein DctP [Pikeienuella sp.]
MGFREFVMVTAGLTVCATAALGAEMRLSHQWSDTDIRHQVAEIVAEGARAAGVEIEIFPRRQLYAPNDQYGAMLAGDLEMSLFPLAYAADRHRAFDLTLMPGLIKNHDHAARFVESAFMDEIEKILEADGLKVLVHGYLSGGFMGAERCITKPEDVEGLTMRAAGAAFEAMLAGAGAGIESMPSSRIYEAIDTGLINGANTSSASFVSYKLYEQGACLTPPGEFALWFMYHPILMNKAAFDALTPAQQTALLDAGGEAQRFFLDSVKGTDDTVRAVFAEQGVEIADMSFDDYVGWVGLAKMTSYENYLQDDPEALRLLNLALSVE